MQGPISTWRAGLLLAGLLSALPLLGGCAAQVTPPLQLEVPAKIFVLDHGRHTSLVVSTPDGDLVRYAYGDWRYYAERETGFAQAVAALLWRTPAALGRREFPGPATADTVRSRVAVNIDTVHEIDVEREKVESLRVELDSIFMAAERVRETIETQLFFVPHPRAYNWRHNSNTVIAGWLERLGCEITGPTLLARWRIEQPTTGEIE